MHMPNSCWTKRITLNISISSNSTSSLKNSCLFIRFISFVVSVKRNALYFILGGTICTSNFLSSSQRCTRVTNISTKYFITNNKYTYTSWARESKINTWRFIESISYSNKRLIKLLFNFSRIYNTLINLCLIKSELNWLFNLFCKHSLYIFTYKLSIDTMTICHCKEMSSSIFT